MSLDWQTVDADIDLQTFVNNYLLLSGRRCFVVEENKRTIGLITTHEVKHVDRERWALTKVRDAMLPADRLHIVQPDTPVRDALEKMGREDVNQLLVLTDGHLEGTISRGDILRMLQMRMELS
jgi:predicted transcriptional regulator